MKKIKYVSLLALSFMAILALTQFYTNADQKSDVEVAYDIMIKAEKENRNLTEKEVEEVEKVANKLIAYDNDMTDTDKDINRSVSAMYLNFYETMSDGEPTHYNKAKELYRSYQN